MNKLLGMNRRKGQTDSVSVYPLDTASILPAGRFVMLQAGTSSTDEVVVVLSDGTKVDGVSGITVLSPIVFSAYQDVVTSSTNVSVEVAEGDSITAGAYVYAGADGFAVSSGVIPIGVALRSSESGYSNGAQEGLSGVDVKLTIPFAVNLTDPTGAGAGGGAMASTSTKKNKKDDGGIE